MLQNSAVAAVFYRLCKLSKNSTASKLHNKTVLGIKNLFSGSVFGAFILLCIKDYGEIENKYGGESVFYTALKGFFGAIFNKGKKAAGSFKKLNGLSINQKLFDRYGNSAKFIKIFKPENLLPFLIVVMFVVPHDYWDNSYALGIAIITALVYFLSACFGGKVGENPVAVWLSFILFTFAAVLGVIASFNVGDSIRVFVFFIISFILYIAVYGTLTSYKRFLKFVMFMYAGLIITSIYAVYQRITGVSVDPSLTDTLLNKNMPGRVFSTFGNPNNYAEYLMLFIPFCFAGILGIKNKALKIMGLGGLLIPIAALALTYSRGCWIAFAIAAVVFGVLYNIKTLYIIIAGALMAVPLLPSTILNRMLTIGNMADTSSSYRFIIWEGSAKMLKKHWFTGIGLGPGAFKAIYPRFALERAITAPHSHMQFMEILIEMGIIGLIAFSWFTLCLIFRSYRAGRNLQNNRLRTLAIAATATMACIGFIGLVEYIWFYPRVMFAFFISAGMVGAITKISAKEKAL